MVQYPRRIYLRGLIKDGHTNQVVLLVHSSSELYSYFDVKYRDVKTGLVDLFVVVFFYLVLVEVNEICGMTLKMTV